MDEMSNIEKPKHPCWHCMERHAACCKECDRWKTYEAARNAWYKEHAKEIEAKQLSMDYIENF